jgi:hypothetical protein
MMECAAFPEKVREMGRSAQRKMADYTVFAATESLTAAISGVLARA